MSLLSIKNLSFAWGGPLLLDHINLEIDKGEKIGLLGRNGTGKSTLMKLIASEVDPDDGEIRRANGLNIARLEQEVPMGDGGRIFDIVSQGMDLVDKDGHKPEEWEIDHAVEKVLSKMNLDAEAIFDTLSSGMKRRVLLAKALVSEPDILLLDEPTNHLDVDAISWLEGFLKKYQGTLIFVTHDRVFLQTLANRILEIDRGNVFDWTCDYATFLKRKEAALGAEEKQNALFDKKLAQEEVWIRKGIKARRTRNEGRVRALKKLREEFSQRRKKIGNVRMQATSGERSGLLVIEAKDVNFSYGNDTIIHEFSTLISRGDKIGIIGTNGTGKSTLLKLLLGELSPQSGNIRHGTNLDIIYFDQLREQIEEEKTVVENVGEGKQTLVINGKEKNIYGYLQDFLFTPERARRPARYLSGGERNRLLLAKIFKHPSNFLVLDEPTNDLDSETLELLEELLLDYKGTVLLVSHDRAFLNNVVTSTFVFQGEGRIKEYAGGYDDYVRQSNQIEVSVSPEEFNKPDNANSNQPKEKAKIKLNYKEQKELETLPALLEKLETRQAELHDQMAAPDFFKKEGDLISQSNKELEKLNTDLTEAYSRWEALEARN
jgi:ABC transport system ATP-binding/permease protein